VNTSELVAKIAEAHSVSKTQAQAIVDSMLKTILGAAANGEEISLPGFGKFKVQGNAGTRGAQSDQRRENQDRRLAQTHLFACKGGEGAPERLSSGAKPRAGFA
jgi:nucleoid DNA-binding protein